MMTATTEKPTINLAIDIETTGAFIGKDKLFGIGFAYVDEEGKLVKKKIMSDLRKYDDETWQECWQRNGWEMRCWNDFWSKQVYRTPEQLADERCKAAGLPLPDVQYPLMLDKLMEDTDVDGSVEGDMADAVNRYLQELESKFTIKHIVCDTIMFDGGFTNHLLATRGHAPLYYSRDMKEYRTGFEKDSCLRGVFLSLTGKFNWNMNIPILNKMLPNLVAPPHDHDPSNDAAEHIIFFEKTKALAADLRDAVPRWSDGAMQAMTDDDDVEIFPEWCNSLKQ